MASKPKETAEAMWLDYAGKVYPGLSEDSLQFSECKKTFYAGMLSASGYIANSTDDFQSTVLLVAITDIGQLDAELHEYFTAVLTDPTKWGKNVG